jgi:manganese oxidase
VVEFVADTPGDWAMHCHMTHHVMTQMGHDIPITLGANTKQVDPKIRKLVPGYMTMGQTGMGEMAEMDMPSPANSLAMRPTPGPFGAIDMGGMFTVIKVRDNPALEDGTGWHTHPAGTVATSATPEDLAADGIDPKTS